ELPNQQCRRAARIAVLAITRAKDDARDRAILSRQEDVLPRGALEVHAPQPGPLRIGESGQNVELLPFPEQPNAPGLLRLVEKQSWGNEIFCEHVFSGASVGWHSSPMRSRGPAPNLRHSTSAESPGPQQGRDRSQWIATAPDRRAAVASSAQAKKRSRCNGISAAMFPTRDYDRLRPAGSSFGAHQDRGNTMAGRNPFLPTLRATAVAVLLVLGPTANLFAEGAPATQTRLPQDVITEHVVELPGRTLRFTATAGSFPLTNSKGKVLAEMGYIAYTLDGMPADQRPVTFALNGGPGSASAWLQIGALGPWRIRMEQAAASPSAP